MEERGVTRLEVCKPAGTDPWMEDVLSRFCKETGRSFVLHVLPDGEPQPSGLKNRLKALYYRLPAPAKALLRFPAWLWIVRRRLPRTHVPRPVLPEGTKPASIVTYFPNIDMAAAKNGRFRSRYWESSTTPSRPPRGRLTRVNWVFIYFPAPQCSFPEAVKLRDRFRENGRDGASFHFLKNFLPPGTSGKASSASASSSSPAGPWSRKSGELFRFPGSRMDLWPVLRRNWEDSTRGWRALERCLMREAFRRYAQWAGPQEWTTFPQENCPWERMLCQSMHDAEAGPVYGAQHSTVRPTDFRYFDDPRMIDDPACRRAMPELWLCNGTGARDALLVGHMPEERAALVEALRYLYLAPKAGEEAAPEVKSTRLLVVTSFFADETDAHLATLAASAKAGLLDGWEVIVKPHPYLPVDGRLKKPLRQAEPPKIVDGAIGNFLTPGRRSGLPTPPPWRSKPPSAGSPCWCRPPRTTWTSAPCRGCPASSPCARPRTWPPPLPRPRPRICPRTTSPSIRRFPAGGNGWDCRHARTRETTRRAESFGFSGAFPEPRTTPG